ncbi:unnamed protein product [Pedinophyceae sp. YPF-701]|nr:unnamed protein product [Pedinophyceae sp. YPF-701]
MTTRCLPLLLAAVLLLASSVHGRETRARGMAVDIGEVVVKNVRRGSVTIEGGDDKKIVIEDDGWSVNIEGGSLLADWGARERGIGVINVAFPEGVLYIDEDGAGKLKVGGEEWTWTLDARGEVVLSTLPAMDPLP